jgi:hypothetical protein
MLLWVLGLGCLPDSRLFGEQGFGSYVHTNFWVQHHDPRGEHNMGGLMPSEPKHGTLLELWVGALRGHQETLPKQSKRDSLVLPIKWHTGHVQSHKH